MIEFLDVVVKLDDRGFLTTDLYTKPTDSKSYLHFSSDHPIHTKKAIPFGLGLRAKVSDLERKISRSTERN